jgi:hypothetical protein
MSSPAGFAAAGFASPVQYTVTALNQSTSKTYTVTVSLGPIPPTQLSTVRAISAFSFDAISLSQTTTVISSTPDASGKYHIEITVPPPPSGTIETYLGNLTPVITYTGNSIAGIGLTDTNSVFETPKTATGSSTSFVSPPSYTVTAEDPAQTSEYVVTVRAEDNNAKEITGFYFTNPVALGAIDQNAKTITVTVPNGTNLGALSPMVSYTGVSLDPASGTAVNFSSPVTYTVTARNGTVQPYTVRVKPKPAAAREITAVAFPGAAVIETIIGAIPGSDGNIPISVTVSDQTNINALRPTITHTGVSITPPQGTPQSATPFTDTSRNFGSPQVYRVTAEDGSFKDYAVSVHRSGGGSKIITGFVFKSVPVSGGTVSIVGQIDQDNHTIKVNLPHTATTFVLEPTITYLGKSAAYTGTGTGGTPQDQDTASLGQRGNTYKDKPRDFTNSATTPLYYTVTAADPPPGNTQEYTVKVTKLPEVTIKYEGPWDDKFVTDNFDQSTGLLTITIDTTTQFPISNPSYRYNSPYDWYVDGVDQPVSVTQNTLVIKTADFKLGQHRVTASATKSDGKHYTNHVYFLVRE